MEQEFNNSNFSDPLSEQEEEKSLNFELEEDCNSNSKSFVEWKEFSKTIFTKPLKLQIHALILKDQRI